MGLDNLPEVKLAKKIFALHRLEIPFDIEALVKEYATIIYKKIPIEGIDGVCINLKIPGKSPKIIVSSTISSKRKTFTLAHELGHIIIPWHLGTIIDENYSQMYKDYEYNTIEQEANRFAAELLMPSKWIIKKYHYINEDISQLQNEIVNQCNVSAQAAAIKILNLLPIGIIYCAVENEVVVHTGHTNNTSVSLQSIGSNFDEKFYPYYSYYKQYNANSIIYHWWNLNTNIEVKEIKDDRDWKEIFDTIIKDIGIVDYELVKLYKMSINGIVGAANDRIKRHSESYSTEIVISSVIYSLRRPEHKDFTSHKDFELFVLRKVNSIFEKQNKVK